MYVLVIFGIMLIDSVNIVLSDNPNIIENVFSL